VFHPILSRVTIAAALLVSMLVVQAPQQQLPPQPPSGAVVEGIVVDFASGQPIEGALVELRRGQGASPRIVFSPFGELQTPAPPLSTLTGLDGKFVFRDPPVGESRLYATKMRGHAPAEYGQRTPTGTGTSLNIAAGQKITGVTLRMSPVGSIAGRIFDAAGDAVVYASVEVVRSGYLDGKRRLIRVQITRTDDRGEYRFYSLPPGEYFVVARPWDARSTRGTLANEPTIIPSRSASGEGASSPLITRRVLESGEIVEETWLSIYYPGTTDARSARPINLRMGDNIGGIDVSLALSAVPARRVRGVVIDGTTGMPAAGALVRLTPHEQLAPAVIMPMATADRNGVFEVIGVLPAMYSLIVSGGGPSPGGLPGAAPSGTLNGYAVVDATGGDVNNLQIVAVRGLDIPVRVTFDSGAGLLPVPPAPPGVTVIGPNGEPLRTVTGTPASTSLRITLTREPGTGSPTGNFVITAGWPGIPNTTVSPRIEALPNGGFMLTGANLGNFRVSVSGLTQGSYVKSIRKGQVDVLRDGLGITGSANPADEPLEIAIGANAGSFTGRVLNDAGLPVPNVTVALVPNPQLRSRMELYQSVSTDTTGAFRFQGIVPDEYTLFAWEEVTTGAWHDAEFLRPYESRGVVVSVGSSSNPPQTLRMIPWSNR
jgi:protocatechuate 3,4-dioxygenase beta subunit